MAAARGNDDIFPTTATLAAALAAFEWMQHNERSLGGFGQTPPPPPARLDEGSSSVKHALLAENVRITELPTDFRLSYSSTSSYHPPPERAQNYKIDST